MPTRTNIVEPYEICKFAEKHYNISNDLARQMTWWVTPELENKTYKYSLTDIRQEMKDDPEEESSYPEFPVTPYQMLVDFMMANNITYFTLTQ